MFLDIRSAGDLVQTCIEMVNNVLFQKNFSAISSYDIGTVLYSTYKSVPTMLLQYNYEMLLFSILKEKNHCSHKRHLTSFSCFCA